MRHAFALIALPCAAVAAPAPKLPRDAPWCAAPDAVPLFLSPMGEPFRGTRGAAWPSAAWLAQADTNRDGALDRAELAEDGARFFAALDTNRDGRLTPDEVDRYEREVAPEIALYQARRRVMPAERSRRPRAGESGYGGPLGAGAFAWLNVPEPVSAADMDFDRAIDAREFAAAAARRFDSLDKAGAGALRLPALGPTPFQTAIEGPCRPQPVSSPERRRGPDAGPPEEMR